MYAIFQSPFLGSYEIINSKMYLMCVDHLSTKVYLQECKRQTKPNQNKLQVCHVLFYFFL